MNREILHRKLKRLAFLCVLGFTAHHGMALEAPVFSPAGGLVQAPNLLSITHSNPSGVIFYTTDGTDPRDPQGKVRRKARVHPAVFEKKGFGVPLSINRPMTVCARVKSGEEWSDLQAATYSVDQDFSQLLITEIMYHPTATVETPRDEEFIEFKNVGDFPLDLSGLRIVDYTRGPEPAVPIYTFPEGLTARPGGFVVLVANPANFESLYPDVPYDGVIPRGFGGKAPFDNDDGRIALIGPDGSVATNMRYESHAPWQVIPDNHGYFRHHSSFVGFSLTRTNLDPDADPEYFGTWRSSAARLGSPGSDDPDPGIPPLLINELRARSGGDLVDAVEIYNPTSEDVPIGGWWLSDARNAPYGYQFAAHMVVPREGYLVVDEHDFAAGGSDLAFNSARERCYLFSGDQNGELTGYSHGFLYRGSDRNATFGRVTTSDGFDHFLPEKAPTLGGPNQGPVLPQLVITEIMLQPDPGGFPYVELRNIGPDPLPLWETGHPDRTWSIGWDLSPGGGSSVFPAGVTVPPGGFVIVVAEELLPVEVPDHVQVLGLPDMYPFKARGCVSLFRPSGTTGAGDHPRAVLVDQVKYQSLALEDPEALEPGRSLERIGRNRLGAEPRNWVAGPVGGTLGRDWEGSFPVPTLSPVRQVDQLEIRFFAEAGYRYSLEESSDLETWTLSSAIPIVGDDSEASFRMSLLGGSSYFRAVVQSDLPPTGAP